MIKYMTSRYLTSIEPIKVERETTSSVWINGRRHAKMGDFYKYFDTFYDAHCYLVAEAEREVDSCRLSLERAKGKFGNIIGLKEKC